MLSQLPKLFDRFFAVGFFLPAALIVFLSIEILGAFSLKVGPAIAGKDPYLSAAMDLVVSWFFALLLVAMNRAIYRFYQGYGDYNPLAWGKTRHLRRFRDEAQAAFETQEAIEQVRAEGGRPEIEPDHASNLNRAVRDFPDDEGWVMPTRFGNEFRAFEVYPRAVYGIDAVPLWPRIKILLPKNFEEAILEAKSQMDFCINLSAGGFLLAVVYAVCAALTFSLPHPWMPVLALIVGYVGYLLTCATSVGYGDHFKAAFDLYRHDLAKQLNLDVPRSASHERDMWAKVSRMMIYRSPNRFDELTSYKKRD